MECLLQFLAHLQLFVGNLQKFLRTVSLASFVLGFFLFLRLRIEKRLVEVVVSVVGADVACFPFLVIGDADAASMNNRS